MKFEDLVNSTELIAQTHPGYLKDWLYVLLCTGKKIDTCLFDLTQPADDRLVVVAGSSAGAAEIVAEFREATRIASESS